MTRFGALLLLLAAAAGCRGPSPRTDAAPSLDTARLERIQRIGDGFLPDRRVAWGLSPRAGLGAWAWPEGRVNVTRALADRLDDEELAAALAHELGHLLDGGHLPAAPLALGGGTGDLERRADRIGCTLLVRRGVPCAAMARMLTKLADGRGGDAEIARRATLADATCAAAPR